MAEGPSPDLLSRLDERTKSIQSNIERLSTDLRAHNDTMTAKILHVEGRLEKRIDELESDLSGDYVKKDQFHPIQKLVYGVVAIILTSVTVGLVTIVINKPGVAN